MRGSRTLRWDSDSKSQIGVMAFAIIAPAGSGQVAEWMTRESAYQDPFGGGRDDRFTGWLELPMSRGC